MLSRRKVLKGAVALPLATLSPVQSRADTREGFFELRAAQTDHRVGERSNALSSLWLYNRQSPGPEIRVKRGQRVRVRFFNNLAEPSSIHWHGIRIANAMDGVPGLTQKAVPPGGFFDYDFVAPDAGTYWYHAHDHSWAQVGRGLYGPLIVEDDQRHPGIDEMTLMLDDWRLDETGRLVADFDDYMREKQFGRIGETVTVNGRRPGLSIPLASDRFYRVRLINAANARIFRLHLRKMEARIVAFDGQTLRHASTPGSLTLAPAQRIDLVIRIGAGKSGWIEDSDGTIPTGSPDRDRAVLIAFRGDAGQASANRAFPEFPSGNLADPVLEDARRIPLVMEGGSLSSVGTAMFRGRKLETGQLATARQVWTFNGTANLPLEPLFRISRGCPVIIEMNNRTGFEHAMHVHGHHFRTIGTEGGLGPWRDTTFMAAQSSKDIAFVADNPGKWLLHCHMLEHAAAGMRTWFEVI